MLFKKTTKEILGIVIAIVTISGAISGVFIWHYDAKISLQEDRHQQEISSMQNIFSDTKQIFLLKDILVNDINNMLPTNGKYFPKNNVYALEKINGFKYFKSTEDNLYNLLNNCNQKTLWKKIFDAESKDKLTIKQNKANIQFEKYLKKKILSKIKPTINYWVQKKSTGIKSCVIEFKIKNETLKTAIKNTIDLFTDPIFNMGNTDIFASMKKELDKKNSKEIFNEFALLFSSFIVKYSKQQLVLKKEKELFMDFFLPNNHIILLAILNEKDINFAILSNYHKEPVPNKGIENKMNYWLSQYRIILNKDNLDNGTD